jgi:hypothetical protein
MLPGGGASFGPSALMLLSVGALLAVIVKFLFFF